MYTDKKMKEAEFHTGKYPYANEKAAYSAQRANKKSKMPRTDVSAFK